ncbi:hypothetical protein V1514DRAFT_318385 [Lipomyces japonicus]|uniref:uncharacterized protein n=1 Tax=Lipomyces japonicus TaxID=56871 RepID=UPI0034CE24F3
MDPMSSVIVLILTLLFPPIGVLLLSGCSIDFAINVGLTLLGYLPGLLHALYLEYIYYSRREDAAHGSLTVDRAPGIYSDVVQRGGYKSLRRVNSHDTSAQSH